MNGAEQSILNELKWIKNKQVAHDKLFGKIFEKFETGTGKIRDNRENIAVLTETLTTHKKLFYALFSLAGTGVIGLVIKLISIIL